MSDTDYHQSVAAVTPLGSIGTARQASALDRARRALRNLGSVVTSMVTMGTKPQAFLGARWISTLLAICPAPLKRDAALWVLSLSPHYFYRKLSPAYESMPFKRFVEAECERNADARGKILDLILAPFLKSSMRVVDYGCGPGFLARHVSGRVEKVFAIDISQGVLDCAKIINGRPNIEFVSVDALGERITDQSIDLVYSFAVIQHVTDEVLADIFSICSRLLKQGGSAVLHVELESEAFPSERSWREDTSLAGKLKFQYGLHCFGRTPEFFAALAQRHGLAVASFDPIAARCPERFDDICDGALLVLTKV